MRNRVSEIGFEQERELECRVVVGLVGLAGRSNRNECERKRKQESEERIERRAQRGIEREAVGGRIRRAGDLWAWSQFGGALLRTTTYTQTKTVYHRTLSY